MDRAGAGELGAGAGLLDGLQCALGLDGGGRALSRTDHGTPRAGSENSDQLNIPNYCPEKMIHFAKYIHDSTGKLE